jgi:hypothetical protein
MVARQPLPCIICGFQPEPCFKDADDEDRHQPFGATMFTTTGHYGSTVFDSINGDELSINVCDPCLKAAAGQGIVWFTRYAIQAPVPTLVSRPWQM